MKKLFLISILFFQVISYGQRLEIILPTETVLKDAPDITSNIIEILQEEKNALLLDKSLDDFWKIEYLNKEYYVRESFLLKRNGESFITFKDNLFAKKQKKKESDKLKFFVYRDSLTNDFKKNLNLKAKPNDIIKLTKLFFSIPDKDEFESTKDFEKRIRIDTSKVYCFDYFLSTSNSGVNYDADKEIFNHSCSFTIGEIIEIKFDKLKTYIGTNAFGKKGKVQVYQYTRYSLRSSESLWNLLNTKKQKFGDGELKIPLSKERAKDAKYFLVGRVGISFSSFTDKQHTDEHKTPTIDDPSEIYYDYYTLIGEIRFIVFYNILTKEIYDIYLP